MSVNIGLMIWREMKRKNLSAAALADSLGIGKNRLQTILKETSIDTDLLLKVCEVLNFNFFQYFENTNLSKKLTSQSLLDAKAEIEMLKALIKEKNSIIDLKDQLLKSQASIITILEKG
ncbi:MAG: helix-turn-helix transcriptional regulator [Pedobacter sp.]|uniref:helix-turn-helix domain-containing protein n=1 Tax=Pedobacter sp. TaxID=1411316 RepID=UPI003394BB56